MTKTLTRLALLAAVLAAAFTWVPASRQNPAERLGDKLAREGQVIVDALKGKEEPLFQLRFEGPFLWPSLAVVAGALAVALGIFPTLVGGSDRFVSGLAVLIGAAIVVWQVWGQ